ncbi:MAG TPA: PCRF domain-containing protein, partial [Flavobacterium sp.]|nr:PCRF domain-containing protein [Flavobacterium sp.]
MTNEEEKTFAPDFWNNAKEAEILVKNLRSKKKWIEDYNKAVDMTDELQLAYDFYKEGELTIEELDHQYEVTQAHIEAIEFKNMLSEEGDSLSAVLQITAGAGGTESCDWASMLMRMYMMWAEKEGYKIRELNYQEGDVAGIKTVTLEIE